MAVNWDLLRSALGDGYDAGSWFIVSEELIRRRRDRQFANKPGRRPVVLATTPGPNAVLFARSTSIPSTFPHSSHVHEDWGARCDVNRDGWVALDVPVTVSSESLDQRTYSCLEPDDTGLVDALRQRVVP